MRVHTGWGAVLVASSWGMLGGCEPFAACQMRLCNVWQLSQLQAFLRGSEPVLYLPSPKLPAPGLAHGRLPAFPWRVWTADLQALRGPWLVHRRMQECPGGLEGLQAAGVVSLGFGSGCGGSAWMTLWGLHLLYQTAQSPGVHKLLQCLEVSTLKSKAPEKCSMHTMMIILHFMKTCIS